MDAAYFLDSTNLRLASLILAGINFSLTLSSAVTPILAKS